MKPATDRQKMQPFFLKSQESMGLNAARMNLKTQAAFRNNAAASNDRVQNKTFQD